MKIIDFFHSKVSVHPFLIIFYFILHYTIEYGDSLYSWYEPLLYLTVLFIITIIIEAITSKIIFDKFNVQYVVSAILITILFFQEIATLSTSLLPFVLRRRYLLLFCGINILGLTTYLFKSRRKLQPNLFLHALLLIYITIDLYSLLTIKTVEDNVSNNPLQDSTKFNTYPDIYLLLVDGYTNSESLKKYYHFDNTPFIDSLQKKGFYIAKKSKSNYPFTLMTLTSALNLSYLNTTQKNILESFLDQISTNRFTNTLEQNHYSIFNYSIFNFHKHKSPHNLKIWFHKKNLLSFYISKSLFWDFLVKHDKGEGLSRELNVFKSLDSTAISVKAVNPKFVYAHCLLTHVPFYLNKQGVFDKEVDTRSPGLAGIAHLLDEDSDNNTFGNTQIDSLISYDYVNHIKFTNLKCLSSINTILQNQYRPTIIILLSDHGSRMLTHKFSQKEAISERYTNFCAIYYSDRNYLKLYDSITPINVMRHVLNKSINTNYTNLKDISGLIVK